MNDKSIYQKMVELGVPISHHFSDLYVPMTVETMRIIDEYEFKTNVRTFTNQVVGGTWYDIPFAYEPYWTEKGAKTVGELASDMSDELVRFVNKIY